MTEFDNTNRGVLFRAKEKRSEKSPDYTGKINVDGRELWLSAWIRESKAGGKFMSLSVREPVLQDAAPAAEAPKAAPVEDFNDSIPFD